LFSKRQLVTVIVGGVLMFFAEQYGVALGHEAGCKRGWQMAQDSRTAALMALNDTYPDQFLQLSHFVPAVMSQSDWLTFCAP
jgi:hypothetical protein